MRRALLWGLVVAALWPWRAAPGGHAPLALRLLGPFASLAASVEWVRFDLAAREGRYEAAYARAERALTLDPRSPQGWVTLAAHLAYARGSLENEPDAAARRRWFRAAVDLLQRGEELAGEPGELAFARGLVLAQVALVDGAEELGWPGGAGAAAQEAARAFDRAAALGHPQGRILAARVADPDFAR